MLRIGLAIGLLLATAPAAAQSDDDLMRFAADMAQRGNWREARYRWEALLRRDAENAKVVNNLAVAREVMGETAEARTWYLDAAKLWPDNVDIAENVRRYSHFWRYWNDDESGETRQTLPPPAPAADNKKKKKKKAKTTRVAVRLPVPARLEIRGDEKLLVTSFRAGENAMIDTNYELVEFLRGEFRKDTALDVLEIDPPPAIPEQTIADLLANTEFWQHLGRNYDSEIIVSGVVNYTREDQSGYQEVDVISAATGQKVRQSRFVEQEEFRYVVDLFFIDGPTGTLRFRDRLQRAVVFQGQSNDPVAAFFSLSESIAADVLAVVTPRVREDSRVIFTR